MRMLNLALAGALSLSAGQALAEAEFRADLAALKACAPDVARLCHDIVPGAGRIRTCMKKNIGTLSDSCVDAMIVAAVGEDKKPVPVPPHPTDMTFTDLRGVQYCEVWTMYGNAHTGYFGDYFNTSGLNNAADPKDTCPPNLWAKVSVEKLRDEFAIFWAFKNGPRGWTFDDITLPVGPVVNFFGVETRWWGRGVLPDTAALAKIQNGLKPYAELQSHRRSTFTFKAGRPLFILDDPDGTPWVMQAWSRIVDPALSYDDLTALGSRLTLPEGWRFRVATLPQDLILSTPMGYNWIVQDDLGNTYDACKDGACNLQP